MTHEHPGGIGDCARLQELAGLFEDTEQRNFYYKQAQKTVEQEFEGEWYRSDELVLGGLMLLLYTWNSAAPQTKQMDATEIKDILETNHAHIDSVREATLLDAEFAHDSPVYDTIAAVYPPFQDYFGQTGASKVLSLLNPDLFVMWDSDIRARRATSRDDHQSGQRADRGVYFYLREHGYDPQNTKDEFGQHANDYVAYLRYCKEILSETRDCPLFNQRETARAKLLDEALYAFYKIEQED